MGKIKKIHLVIGSGTLLVAAFLFHQLGLLVLQEVMLLTATGIAGWSIAKKAIQSIMMKSFSIELLVTIAVVGAILIGEYVESAVVTFLFLFGAYLELRSLEKTRNSLKSLVDMAPQIATVVRGGKSLILPIEEVLVGDRILLQSGTKVAVDGRVISGHGFMNEATITGESVPVVKKVDDHVFSGTVVDNGYMEVIAEKVGEDTTFSKIIELVEEAQEAKARTQKFIEKFANLYTPGILMMSILVFLITRNIELTLTFLVIACPGALVISAPVSLVSGIGNGAKKGILMKGGEVIESLAKVDVVVFDKTGTLTAGKPTVTSITSYNMDKMAFLQLAAEAEQISEHHLGKTIVKEAEARGISLVNKPGQFTVEKGHGIVTKFHQRFVILGNKKLIEKHNIELSHSQKLEIEKQELLGNTVVIVAVDGHVEGHISIADQVRHEAVEAIQQLKELGIKKTLILTGDNKYTAEKVAKQLGIDHVYAEMLPEEKVAHIKQLQEAGYRVAMVGDGINDTPALAMADLGIAMGAAGTDIAIETADVVLMSDNLQRIGYGYALAKAAIRNMKQNMALAVGTVVLLLLGVLYGKIFLSAGMLIHEISVLVVILNAIRLLQFGRKVNGTYGRVKTSLQSSW
ncbi:heavy metal translocating P-type ATPase [Bacillus sp. PS06]|uniref:heavy metal translocating P-type ATPase n=1 Tax=Bacillus sp. PS06 TaxID=2764176 RepID=UPI00178728D9|nr:cation-translocating P-type ATPase [Bacillus sp. PS06]MBD8069816.1 cation-translocating P-type ATPase [Bacillus sp. PS06]